MKTTQFPVSTIAEAATRGFTTSVRKNKHLALPGDAIRLERDHRAALQPNLRCVGGLRSDATPARSGSAVFSKLCLGQTLTPAPLSIATLLCLVAIFSRPGVSNAPIVTFSMPGVPIVSPGPPPPSSPSSRRRNRLPCAPGFATACPVHVCRTPPLAGRPEVLPKIFSAACEVHETRPELWDSDALPPPPSRSP